MNRRGARGLCRALATAFVLLMTPLALAAPPSPSVQEAKRRFDEGVAAYDAGNYEASRLAFAQAYALEPLAELLINLGHAELKTERYVDGCRHISRALREAEIGLGERRAAERALKGAELHVARLKINVNTDGASVKIDGEDVGTSPMIYTWYLEAGEHHVHASKEGYTSDEQVLGISRGQIKTVHLKLTSTTGPKGPPKSIDSPSEPLSDEGASDSPSLVPVWIGGGLTLVGVATGVVFTLDANAKRSDRDDQLGALESASGGNPCTPGPANATPCQEIDSLNSKARTSQTVGIAGFAVGGAALIGTVVYYLLASNHEPDANAVSAGALLTPQGAGFTLSGSF